MIQSMSARVQVLLGTDGFDLQPAMQGLPPRRCLKRQQLQASTEQQAGIDKPEDEVDIEVS